MFWMKKPDLILLLCLFPLLAFAQEPVVHPLFKIERSKNANIIQYDARSDEDGKLLKKKPLVGYWIRLAEQGQVKKLTWVQNTFAYGFKTKLAKDRESAEMDMVVDVGSPISVIRAGDSYRATIPLNGKTAWLERVYVKSNATTFGAKVDYIEIFGKDPDTGEDLYQKIIP